MMPETRTVRLYQETIKHVEQATSLSRNASFAEKTRDVVQRSDQSVTLTPGTIEDLAARTSKLTADEIEERLR